MARELNRLTSSFIRSVKPEPSAKGARLYADGGNLYLQVTPSGTLSWIFRYTLKGKAVPLGLGPVHTINVDHARERALRLRQMLREGKDPRLEVARERHAVAVSRDRTFQPFAEEYIKGIRVNYRNAKAHAQWQSSLSRYAYPIIGGVSLADIDVHLVLQVLTQDNAWNLKPETMRRVRERLERILGAAAVLGYRSAENPARYTNYLSEVLPSHKHVRRKKHHPSLRYQLIPAFFAALYDQPPAVSYRALAFLTLTAARTGEVLGARWAEIDLVLCVWTIPAERTKAGREHRIPLSAASVELLEIQRRVVPSHIPYVFPGAKRGKTISQMSMLQAMRGMAERGLLPESAVPHGMRSSFRSWTAAETEFPRDLAEAALAHVLSAVEGAYQRDDQLVRRRALMEAWADYCMSIVGVEREHG